jgi:hypothetical protein
VWERRIEGISEADLAGLGMVDRVLTPAGGFRNDRTDASLHMRGCFEVESLGVK